MKTIETEVYQYSELSPAAKEKARDWYMTDLPPEFWGADHVIEDAVTILGLMGFEVKTHSVRLMSGKSRQAPCVWWSGFSCQGDGASFKGWFKGQPGNLERVMGHAPLDEKLHGIALQLDEALAAAGTEVRCVVTTSGNYSHSHSMDFEFEYPDAGEDANFDEVEKIIKSELRDFADWIYEQLEEEYIYHTSEEQIAETMESNEYTFTAEGNCFG